MTSSLDAALERAQTFSAFSDHVRHLCSDADLEVVVAVAQRALAAGEAEAVTVFDDATGRRTEVEAESRGGPREAAGSILQRLQPGLPAERSGPGRPKLGVVSREVSLLPRHWDWLATRPGGASGAIRRLVDEARKLRRAQDASLAAHEALDRAMTVLAGDQVGFEEALRALYQHQYDRVITLMANWPADLRAHFEHRISLAGELFELARLESLQHEGR